MELFFANIINGQTATLGAEETTHCIKVLRNKPGDIITITNGRGSLYSAMITSVAGKEALLEYSAPNNTRVAEQTVPLVAV